MLQEAIQSIVTEPGGVGSVAQHTWRRFLNLDADARTALSEEIMRFFETRLAQEMEREAAKDTTAADSFVDVLLAALYAIYNGLASPLVWKSAKTSRLREQQVAPSNARGGSSTAAYLLVRICEDYLLRTREVAQLRFCDLLQSTGMGVPLLSLVLYAYGAAVTDVLANANTGSNGSPAKDAVGMCLERLRLASTALTLENEENKHQLTIAHPIFLHVARVGGRAQEALRFFQKPVRTVNPMLTGVGLTDYIAYYAEAALLLASTGQYAAAFYALTPVHSLPPLWGLTEGPRSRGYGNSEAAAAYLVAAGGGNSSNRVTGVTQQQQQQLSSSLKESDVFCVDLYPWYRVKQVSATHIFAAAAGYGAEQAAVEGVVEWRFILSPLPNEIERDQRMRSWALRLSLVLLTLAFGGGNPREVARHFSADAVHSGDGEVDWRGVDSSAMKDHVCFPNLIFYCLSETTRVSLRTLLAAATISSSVEMPVYFDLLRAVAQRDVARAQSLLAAVASTSVFVEDMTLSLAQLAVEEYLPRHIALDTARLYSSVPIRFLMDRIASRSVSEDEQQQHALLTLQRLAHLCATGELQSCHVGNAGTKEAVTVESVVAADGAEELSLHVATTSIQFTVPSLSQCLQICARIASQRPLSYHWPARPADEPSTSNSSLVQMLKQLQALQLVMKAEHTALQALR
jgi:hypothetical protein